MEKLAKMTKTEFEQKHDNGKYVLFLRQTGARTVNLSSL